MTDAGENAGENMNLDLIIKIVRHLGVIGLALILALIVGFHTVRGTSDRYTGSQAAADKALAAAHRERLAAEIAAIKASHAKTSTAFQEHRLLLERLLAEQKRNTQTIDEIKAALRDR